MSVRKEQFNISVGTSIIQVFQRIDIATENIFCEFIDNSYQSFRDNKEKLLRLGQQKCRVDITWTGDTLTIFDNAFGMDREGFQRALRLNNPAKQYSENSLSKYGMGLKYAAANMGNVYVIESTAYGSNFFYKGKIDIENWKVNNPTEMDVDVDDAFSASEHFTKITITHLAHPFTMTGMKIVLRKLGIIYSHFIDKENDLEIYINDQKVKYVEPEIYVEPTGQEAMRIINKEFMFNGKNYYFSGWIAVLNKANVAEAGISLFQNKRAIQLSYRPKAIFGPTNLFCYQRIIGELELTGSNWQVRVNKDGMAWEGSGLEDAFIDALGNMQEMIDIKKIANDRRVRKETKTVKCESVNCNVLGIGSKYKSDEIICFTVTPYEGYSVKYVKIDGKEIEPTDANKYSYKIKEDDPDKITVKIVTVEDKTHLPGPGPSNPYVTPQPVVVIPPVPGPIAMSISQKIEQCFSNLEDIEVPGLDLNLNPLVPVDAAVIKLKNTKFAFKITFTDAQEDFYSLKEIAYPFQNSFNLNINLNKGYFKDVCPTSDVKMAIGVICVSMALSEIITPFYGLNSEHSKMLLSKMNYLVSKSAKL